MPEQVVVRLGRALVSTGGPLVQRTSGGKLLAVYPQGGAYPPHLLMVGSTRGGKTSALRFFVTGLIRSGAGLRPFPPEGGDGAERPRHWTPLLHLADGKFADSFRMFADLPGVVEVANDPQTVAAMVAGFHEQVELAYGELTKAKAIAAKTRGRAPWASPPPQYLVLDEYMNWSLSMGEKARTDAINKLVRIGSVGGEVNCRLWIATQRPDSAKSVEAGLPGLLKSLLLARIAATGLVGMHDLEARMAFDDTKAADRIEAYADRAGLEDRRGLGMIQVGRYEVAYKTPWMADPLHPETSDEDREAAWRLLPDPVVKPEEVAG